MTFAKWTFTLGGVWGLLIVGPMLFLEGWIAANDRGPVAYPETYYGFVGSVLVWQLVYLTIGRDPQRFRPLMPLAMLAKLAFGVAVWTLYATGRTPLNIAVVATPDLILAALFAVAWRKTKPA
ncbi:hypothetical protein [Phenylobacterium sp.]|uniref:hypothetical protein n=1 Tax=Phenylobacterium sp. TaxID=1871053 RepID=UPI002811258F|nr:hypothetical protein [Phenylobacterium sp.]